MTHSKSRSKQKSEAADGGGTEQPVGLAALKAAIEGRSELPV